MSKYIPPGNLVACEYCGLSLDNRVNGIFQFTSGWVEQRAKGGAHAIALPSREYRWACGFCVDSLRKGIPIGQMKLWDAT